MAQFAGLPVAVWGSAALVMSVVWVFVWPSNKVAHVTGVQYLLLRWGHSLVWFLLSLSAAAVTNALTAKFAQPLALAALGIYVAFIAVLIRAG